MADLQKGHTFTEGSSGNTAADLNALVDSGTILPAFITGKSAVVTLEDVDLALVYDNSAAAMRKVTFANIVGSFPADAAAGTAALRTLGTTSVKAAAGNDTRFPASVTGIRLGAGAGSADTAADVDDFTFAPVDLSGVTVIDWSAGDVFTDDLSGNKTYTFSNQAEGRSIQIIIKRNGHTPTLPVAIGSVLVGAGTTFSHSFLTYTSLGTTGLQIAI
jgi:hypothetical protein